MFTKKISGIVLVAILLIAGSTLVFAGQGAMGTQEKQGAPKQVPLPHSKPDSGAQMFKDYCAVCHGMDGRGDGPAVEYLKTPPPNLRTLARRNDGKYPDTKVIAVMQFGSGNKAHGTLDMPFWGPIFRAEGDHGMATLRIHNLTKYIETLQEK